MLPGPLVYRKEDVMRYAHTRESLARRAKAELTKLHDALNDDDEPDAAAILSISEALAALVDDLTAKDGESERPQQFTPFTKNDV
jgi:hypothetical protein